ncbi:superoxide dismutase family protein [Gilvimarinus agarilyticus]|uniref:superoxide dismutase family protein n=1 Tax=Gilvimarinus sp. 2_MG-2023 TaxID=3062666 RepID=UPI001C084E8F|nr:superoxide dismutase family protein [Gilvimarinus sp. 2_MG-2023]MBU2886212.1 superoxide dismutase family protein [Gilvimarinus agarilyticus]MDO6570900.1 superoxide dismutase [Cu-Zn] SodC [Gilvimarinus sp. 2_MG-2023]
MLPLKTLLTAACCSAIVSQAATETASITMYSLDAEGTSQALGEMYIQHNQYGIVFKPELSGLAPGVHGFHLHSNGSCEPSEDGTPGGAAGGHYDPINIDKHGAPWGEGHLGDLPALYVSQSGEATSAVLAPRLQLSDLDEKALIIHRGGDNYSDTPQKLGGGGKRVACGVID